MGAEEVGHKEAEADEAGSLLLGRVTWESLAGAWPGYQGAFADRMNALPKHVVSTTLRDPGWNTVTVIRDDVPGRIARLKAASALPSDWPARSKTWMLFQACGAWPPWKLMYQRCAMPPHPTISCRTDG